MISQGKRQLLAKSLLLVALLTPAAVFAAGTGTGTASAGSAGATSAMTHMATEISGKVLSYSAATGTLVVHEAINKDVSVFVDKATTVTLDGKPATAALLAANQHVSVLAKQDAGKFVALSVAATVRHS